MKSLYEILVPRTLNGEEIPVEWHQEWDEEIRKYSGGITINSSSKGQWVNGNELISEEVLPVRFLATEQELNKIVEFTAKHYNQHTVLAYKISDNILFYKNLDYQHMEDLRTKLPAPVFVGEGLELRTYQDCLREKLNPNPNPSGKISLPQGLEGRLSMQNHIEKSQKELFEALRNEK